MADSPGQRLAGIFGPRFREAMSIPQEDASVKLARLLMGNGQNTQTGMPTPRGYQMPFAGLQNAPGQALPPFVPPGSAMTEAIGQPPIQQQVTVPAQAPAPAALPSPTAAVQPAATGAAPPPAVVPPMPAAAQVGPTVQQDVAAAVQQMLAANLLPEQFRGAFVNRFGSAG